MQAKIQVSRAQCSRIVPTRSSARTNASWVTSAGSSSPQSLAAIPTRARLLSWYKRPRSAAGASRALTAESALTGLVRKLNTHNSRWLPRASGSGVEADVQHVAVDDDVVLAL